MFARGFESRLGKTEKPASAKILRDDATLRASYQMKKAAALGAAAKAKTKRDVLVKKFCDGLKALVYAKHERKDFAHGLNLITASELRESGKVQGAWAARCDNVIKNVAARTRTLS